MQVWLSSHAYPPLCYESIPPSRTELAPGITYYSCTHIHNNIYIKYRILLINYIYNNRKTIITLCPMVYL